ncbi:Leucine-, isoleucine-, valine-, threonine-, and alanine-binding protein precursor [Hartmannibacter diazotrophicus]|uniref:Leucine-, isoleucine-, valine-, threonine-, and alanine-binding protein n=1 Tax=Hartmannibacter diazotrophicus TaxID=1482074 RepID=A0A2C9D728_9HYPH|nr:branched-chain amino acid ABC transporter substrate-binding protein [Hartmannibacter diazotrophicus]SON56107.1 Leucine-, isoleucine-, valine-, threonine-, and alanine-binding protein precursor [Hartmannibacter diazotrophicus]
MRRIGLALLALLLAHAQALAEVRIAVVGPLNGSFGEIGRSMEAGVTSEAAKFGDILGESISVESYNDGCDAAKAEAIANQLVGRQVNLVVGHVCSLASIAASRIYAANGIIEISPASISPKFTDERAGDTIFRLAPRADTQGTFLGTYLAQTYKGQNVAFLSDSSTYGKDLADRALAAFRAAGGEPSMIETYDSGERSYARLAAKLAADGIEVLFIGGYHGDISQIGFDLAAVGPLPVIVGGDTLMLDDYPALGKAVAEHTIFSAPEGLIGDSEGPDLYFLRAAAAVDIFEAAAEQAGSLDAEKVAAAIARSRFDTAIGSVSFDEKGDALQPGYALYTWKDGRIVPSS